MEDKSVYYEKDLPIPETPAPDETPAPWKKTNILGKRIPRTDAYERMSGAAVYPSDVSLPNMIYGAVKRCPHPHARIKSVDVSAAERMKGVRAVIYKDAADANPAWTYDDQASRLFPEVCRFEGEAVAAAAADTPYIARDALKAIAVDYEVLPFVSDERKALSADVKIHADGNLAGTDEYERGDVEKGFAEADAVLEAAYRTECELHTPMELHGCAAEWTGDSLTIWESTQGVFAVQSQVAETLGLPLSKVRIIGHYMGGGFGSKLQAGKYTVIAALLAGKAARPVKLFLSREETYLAVGNRPPANMTLKAGVKNDGILTALDFTCLGTGGAFQAGGTALTDWLIRDLYRCPNVRTKCTDVFINAGPARPFRAPGHPQGSWALEQMMDALAEKIGMDPAEIRLKNVPARSQGREGAPPYTTTGLKDCILEGARTFEWEASRKRAGDFNRGSPHVKRGVGMGSCVWFVGGGGPPATVIVKLFADGSVNLNMGASDIGTGTRTVMALVCAEELGVNPDVIQIESADTQTTQFATPSGGSKTVPTESPAVRGACIQVKRRLLDMAAEELDADAADLAFRGDAVVLKRDPSHAVRITELSALKKQGVVVGIGYRGPNPADKSVNPFAAQFCEVEVNLRTGEIRVLRFVGANDSGKVLDRLTYDNQVFGGIVMGIGFAMTEMRVLDHNRTGKMVNRNWHDYKLPTAMDAPWDMQSRPVELYDPEANITGTKGLGEPVTIPTAGAIANAVRHATGVRFHDAPLNPLTVMGRLSQHQKEG